MKRIWIIGSIVSFFGAYVSHSTEQGIIAAIVFIVLGILLLIATFLGDNP